VGVCGEGKEEAAEESGFCCSPCRIFLSDTPLSGAEGENRICPLFLRKQLWGQFVRLAVIPVSGA